MHQRLQSADRDGDAGDIDVSPFQRVLVAGFISAGNADVAVDVETVRLLRSQLRSKTTLKVIEADLLPLAEIAARTGSKISATAELTTESQGTRHPKPLRSENDLDACQHVFANSPFWKRLGEEYQDPLIVTGTLFLTVRPAGGSLTPTFIFIDGRTGTVIHSERFRENVSYSKKQHIQGLSSYFLLMDRVSPRFLSIVSDQRARGMRTLLR